MKKLIVFTDLDGTLLDHETYSWEAARPAIERLRALGYPLIFNSSKTRAEMQKLREQMDNPHPFICENGSAIAIPAGYFAYRESVHEDIVYLGASYADIIETLSALREQFGYEFIGFNDASTAQIADMTQLDLESATRARQRDASEPIKWLDSDEALERLNAQLQPHGLSMIKGGRFYSVMGRCSKGDAIAWLIDAYRREEPDTDWISVGLGDSRNDLPMLEVVDYPVLIPNPHGAAPATDTLNHLTQPDQPGPAGWNAALLELIESTHQGTHHG